MISILPPESIEKLVNIEYTNTTQNNCGHNLVVKYDLAKVEIRVRFPVPALEFLSPHRSVDRIQASEACDRGSTPRGGTQGSCLWLIIVDKPVDTVDNG